MKRYVALPIGGGIARVALAWTLFLLFLILLGWSFVNFFKRGTSPIPNRPATALVVDGPYRLTRNPMYVAMALLTAAVGFWRDTWWVLLLLVVSIVAVDRLVISRDEAYLKRRFGAEYDAFAARVRRWI